MRVLDVMTPDVVTVGPDAGIKEAARLMIDHGVSGLPVVDAHGVVVGIITEADFLATEASRGRDRSRRLLDALFGEQEPVTAATVREAMTPRPAVVSPDTRLAEAARVMVEHGVKRLPVVDADGHLHGIISRADIVSAFVQPDDVIEERIRQDVIRRILLVDDEELEVSVEEGVVHLEGVLPTKTDHRLLGELALRIEGVLRVENRTTFRVDDTRPDVAL